MSGNCVLDKRSNFHRDCLENKQVESKVQVDKMVAVYVFPSYEHGQLLSEGDKRVGLRGRLVRQ